MIDMFCSTGQTLVLDPALNYARGLKQDTKMCPRVAPECAEV